MLSKEVCSRCCNRFYSVVTWNEVDDGIWLSGEVRCPLLKDTPEALLPRISINEVNPVCPHNFEHAVALGMDHGK